MKDYQERVRLQEELLQELKERFEEAYTQDEIDGLEEEIEAAEEELESLKEELNDWQYCKGDISRLYGMSNKDFY